MKLPTLPQGLLVTEDFAASFDPLMGRHRVDRGAAFFLEEEGVGTVWTFGDCVPQKVTAGLSASERIEASDVKPTRQRYSRVSSWKLEDLMAALPISSYTRRRNPFPRPV